MVRHSGVLLLSRKVESGDSSTCTVTAPRAQEQDFGGSFEAIRKSSDSNEAETDIRITFESKKLEFTVQKRDPPKSEESWDQFWQNLIELSPCFNSVVFSKFSTLVRTSRAKRDSQLGTLPRSLLLQVDHLLLPMGETELTFDSDYFCVTAIFRLHCLFSQNGIQQLSNT